MTTLSPLRDSYRRNIGCFRVISPKGDLKFQ
jgi:hypothetical protein